MKASITIVFVFIINSVIGQSRELFDVQSHILSNSQKQDKSKQQDAIKLFRDYFKTIPSIDVIRKNERIASITGKMPTLTFQKPTLGLMPTIIEKPIISGKIPDLSDRW